MLNLGQNRRFFVPCDLEIWQMTSNNNSAHLFSYFKLCASFHSHLSIQNGVTVRKRQIWVKIGDFLSRVTLKFGRWPWKTIWHLFYATSSLAHNFIAICEFKMELQPGNAQFGSKLAIFLSRVTLKFDGWPWKTIGHLFYAISSFVHHLIAICEFKNGVTVRKRQIWVKIGDILSCVTLTYDLWHWPFAWTSLLLLVITPENFMMIR